MITKIIDRITTYAASVSKPVTVVEFGEATLPAPPYVVVKQEPDIRGTAFRVITHFQPGQQTALRGFVRGTIGNALDDFKATDADGNYNVLNADEGLPSQIVATNDDNTISSERLYWMADFI
ncbi:hypothetical protein KA005_85625 [bacterium]|nr:hypothetical protein [bacterium]